MNKVSKMVARARQVARKLLSEDVAGVVLFGSFAKGKVDELSDLDIALIVKGGKLGLEEKFIDGIRVEIWRYDIKHFLHTFEDEEYRRRSDSWFISSLWIRLLREGLILEDPYGLLSGWKRKALEWRWRKEEITPLIMKAESCLDVAIKAYSRGRLFEGVVALRDCCYNLANAQIMACNRIPSVRPKDIYREVEHLGFKKFFDSIQGLEGLERSRIEHMLSNLEKLLERVWKESRGARTEYENAVKSLARGELEVALLNARYSAFWIGCRILRMRKKSMSTGLYDAESHLKMLSELRDVGDFIEVYRKLHLVEEVSLEYLNKSIKLVKQMLKGLAKLEFQPYRSQSP